MILAAIILTIIAGALRTRLGKLFLAHALMTVSDVLFEAGSQALDNAKRRTGQ